jgi:hypothetical protein
MDEEITTVPLEVSVGDHIVLYNKGTVVDGFISGWMVAGGQVVRVFIENLEEPFKLVGDNAWLALREDEVNG